MQAHTYAHALTIQLHSHIKTYKHSYSHNAIYNVKIKYVLYSHTSRHASNAVTVIARNWTYTHHNLGFITALQTNIIINIHINIVTNVYTYKYY